MADTASSGQHLYVRSLNPDGQDSLAKIARRVRSGSRVLDLGTGPGVLGRYLAETLACQLDGVEYNALAAQLAAPCYRRLEVADLEQVSLASLFGGSTYDYIICADILEHLRDPGRLVEQLAGLLEPSGRLIVSIPNVAYAGLIADLLADEFRYVTEGILDKTHLRFFTRRSLLAFLAEHGFMACNQDSVHVDLRQSEFRARCLDGFPPALVRGLLARPDALTYQFIIEAVLNRDGAVQAIAPTAPDLIPELRFASQLYWRQAHGDYTEQNCSFAFGRMGEARQRLSLPFPASPEGIAGLRLDLADRPGLLRIFELTLHDHEGQLCWAWDGHRSSLESTPSWQLVIADLLPGSACVTLLLTGEDSSLELPIPGELLVTMRQGGELRVLFSWPMSMDYLSLVQHCVPRKDLQLVQSALETRSVALAARAAELESQNALLAAHEIELGLQNTALEDQINEIKARLSEQMRQAVQQAEEVASLRRALADIQASTIWRWSTPYRQAMAWLRGRWR